MPVRIVRENESEPSLREVLPVYLSDLATRASGEHFRTTSRQLKRITASVKTAHPLEVLRYREKRLGVKKRPSNRTVNMEVCALRAMLNWAVDSGIIESHRLDRIKSLPQRSGDLKRKPHALTDDEIGRFLAASVTMDRNRDVPQTPLWRLLLETGIRWGDALALTPENVHGDALYILAEQTKGREGRTIPLPPGLAGEIDLPFRTPTGKHWTHRNEKNARRMLRAALKRAGIARVDPAGRRVYVHALRATAASTMFRRGARLPSVARMLGHADPAFTAKHYLPPDFDALQEEMGRVWTRR